MKASKASDLRKKTAVELQQDLNTALDAQFKLRMQSGSGQLTTNHLINKNRKEIARIKTVMHQLVSGAV